MEELFDIIIASSHRYHLRDIKGAIIMYLSGLNPGHGYSSIPYEVQDIPTAWFALLDSLSEKERRDRLKYIGIWSAKASWYDEEGKHTENVELGVSVEKRHIYIHQLNKSTDNEHYYTFYKKKFDIKTSFITNSAGQKTGIIITNSHKPEVNQITLMIDVSDTTGIEGYNGVVTLLAYGDVLFEKGYESVFPEAIFCKPFVRPLDNSITIAPNNVLSFSNVKCLGKRKDGSIEINGVLDFSSNATIMEIGSFAYDIEKHVEFCFREGLSSYDDTTPEEELFETLNYYSSVLKGKTASDVYRNIFGITPKGKNFNLSFSHLFQCKRVGAIPEKNTIIVFGNTHYDWLKFELNSSIDYHTLGCLFLYLGEAYYKINSYFVEKTGYYEKQEYIDSNFFLESDKENSNLYIDPDNITFEKHSSSNKNDVGYINISTKIDPMDELDNLIGLNNIKADVINLINLVKMQQYRQSKGLRAIPISLHLVFSGNPGTGKTTVARILAQLYKDIGILKTGQLVETDRSDLVAGYVGQTAIKTKEVIDRAIGGILFIDEAYTLAKEGNDFGQEAIDTLLKEMEDHRDEFVVIVAGYQEPMEKFINSNPGLRSRFNKYFLFSDYSADELKEIFLMLCKKYDYTIADSALVLVTNHINTVVKQKGDNFANARDIRNFFENIITLQATRIASKMTFSEKDATTIIDEDIPV